MNGAELKEARHELRLTGKELCRAIAEFSGQPLEGNSLDSLHRSLRNWEAGKIDVPAGIATLVVRMLDEWRRAHDIVERLMRPVVTAGLAKHAKDKAGEPRGGEIALVWYDTPEILRAAAPDQPDLTIGLHRALCRAAAALGDELGAPVVFRKMNIPAYMKWLGKGKNTQESRARWASGQSAGAPWKLSIKMSNQRPGEGALGWVAFDVQRPNDDAGSFPGRKPGDE